MYATVDIGGTKTLVAIFSLEGEVLEQIKFPTPENYSDFLEELTKTVASLSTHEFKAVGVAAPGKIDHAEGEMIVGGNLKWQHVAVSADLEKIFHAPVCLENDAKAAAVAEAKAAGSEFTTVLYLTVSTGIGAGVCVNGELDPALNNAEPGRMDIEHEGKMVPWETVASGKALVAATGKRASELDDAVAWDRHAKILAQGMITLIAIIQPDLIVLGGGVGNHLQKFEQPLLKYLKTYENPSVPIPPIRKAVHPEEAVIYGCYEIVRKRYAA